MSNTLPGNPHCGVLTNTGYTTETPEFAATCQIEATLALAFEQRTANLIAFYGDGGQGEAYVELHNQIVARLGLGGEENTK